MKMWERPIKPKRPKKVSEMGYQPIKKEKPIRWLSLSGILKDILCWWKWKKKKLKLLLNDKSFFIGSDEDE